MTQIKMGTEDNPLTFYYPGTMREFKERYNLWDVILYKREKVTMWGQY